MDKKQINLTIDGNKISVPADFTVMQAADAAGIHIPRLCYHPKLSAVGACRICIVEIEGAKNYSASCITAVSEGMNVKTNSPEIREARRDLVELILDNHPRECQICEKNNNCELQELALTLGIEEYEFPGERKRFAADYSSASIVRDPDKCILCGKCVRVCSEIQGVNVLSVSARGYKANVGPAYDMNMSESVCINCGQCTLFCPTAALTEKDGIKETFKNLNDKEKVCIVQIAPAVRVAIGEAFGFTPGTDKTYETVTALRMLGFKVVFDTQFSADLTIIEEGHEFIKRLTTGGKLPMFTSCSPGWIKYLETFHPEFIENVSTCKSPQQMMGALIKTFYAKKMGLDPAKIYSVSIMPCTAKKYECARPEMNSSGFRDVDVVLTTRELAKMIKQAGIKYKELKKGQFDQPLGESTGAAPIFGVTGGVMEAALRTAYEVITKKELPSIDFKVVRGLTGIKEATVDVAGTKVNVAVVFGLANVHKVLTEIKEGKRNYHFVEVMTCPGGCIGGGGQIYPQGDIEAMDKELYSLRAEGLYSIDEKKKIRKSHENPLITKIYEEFLIKPLGEVSHKLLHTHYHHKCPKGIPSGLRDTVSIG
ncbi:MAG: ferredoxin [Candidatus Firestonebacteria bacterium RIFOXYC2_FULL_39_67]|nr:MAG: ferredoxin [Candidatus Firestonebacteria bacterium RIFOXYD2_FULL_39_29]OGF54291.1 MAG: ferredoxin [Candidatus Firestonebacteria bacterium RIFOXYC2_FULL_39_67]OGF57839.1 MAG: ferredoxin [Candidatus Firestonebacteria bacterium RifOxyC12_full_39_7]